MEHIDYIIIGGLTLAGILTAIGVYCSLVYGGMNEDD